MRRLFKANTKLQQLWLYVNDKTVTLDLPLTIKKKSTIPTYLTIDEKKIAAARIIQHFWRLHKIEKAIVDNAYFSYLSMIAPDDEQRFLSEIMFGRHEAELSKNLKDRSENPFIYANAHYHREDISRHSKGLVFNLLYKAFNLDKVSLDKNTYIPVSKLQVISIEALIKPFKDVRLINSQHSSIALVVIPKKYYNNTAIRVQLMSSGVIATPWEIAEHINSASVDYEKSDQNFKKITLNPNLPQNRKQLLDSDIWSRLGTTASNKKYPTKKLAVCLRRLLVDLPPLNPKAGQRIALMLDIANSYYRYNYPRYAFCIYAIIHEISLILSCNKNSNYLQKSFDNFLSESRYTLHKILGLKHNDLNQSTFVASSALSGMNAFIIAQEIATKMQTKRGKKPRIQLVYPCHYFEFKHVLPDTTFSDEADIFILSTGPIVNPNGLVPGVDINRFIKRVIVDKKRLKPITLILDATSTLYKNLQLNEKAKALVVNGQLSILIVESYQKFCLLHTDQAQQGRLFGFCSKKSFSEAFINEIQTKAQLDFNEHLDMQIGAFISSHCSEVLEEIKQQHFTNGALLRNILTQTPLASREVIAHKDMLTNVDELYFVNSYTNPQKKALIADLIECRSSFGHYVTTASIVVNQLRIAPSATDDIDCLIQASQLYLANYYDPKQLLGMLFENASTQETLALHEQIICLAMIGNILSLQKNNNKVLVKKSLELYCAINSLLIRCPLLKGRVNFTNAYTYLAKLGNAILNKELPEHNQSYLAAINKIYHQNILLTHYLHSHLKANANLCKGVLLLEPLNLKAIIRLINYPTTLAALLKKMDHYKGLENSYFLQAINYLYYHKIVINPFLLSHLKANVKLTKAISLLALIYIDKKLITSLIDQPRKLALFLKYSEGLETCSSLIKKLQLAKIKIDLDMLLQLLTVPNAQPVLHLVLAHHCSLKSQDIQALIKPEVVQFIFKEKNILTESNLATLLILSQVSTAYHQVLHLLENKDFCKAILFVSNANHIILDSLKRAPEKYMTAKEQSPIYLKNCFDALSIFYSKSNTKLTDKQALIKALNEAKDNFCQKALAADRSIFSKTVRLTLMGVVNLLAGLTLGLGHYMHYKYTHQIGFFTQTNSQTMLEKTHNVLDTFLTHPIAH